MKVTMDKHLKGVEFSIWSGEDIKKSSVVHIYEKRTNDKGIPLPNGLRDPKMGSNRGKCVTEVLHSFFIYIRLYIYT